METVAGEFDGGSSVEILPGELLLNLFKMLQSPEMAGYRILDHFFFIKQQADRGFTRS
jgi:hypothetical protein